MPVKHNFYTEREFLKVFLIKLRSFLCFISGSLTGGQTYADNSEPGGRVLKTSFLMLLSVIICVCAAFNLPLQAETDVNSVMRSGRYSDPAAGGETEIAYRLYIPENYRPDRKYSLLIFFHGAGERGNDANHLLYVEQYRYIQNIIDDRELREQFFIFAPQCPEDMVWVCEWSTGTYDFGSTPQTVPEALAMSFVQNVLLKSYSIDRSEIFVTGLSMGGFATWDLLARYPDMFCAAVSVCGGCDPSTASIVKNVPIRAFHSDDDDVVPVTGEYEMCEALGRMGADVKMNILHGWGHYAWVEGYSDRETFDWFIGHRNPSSEGFLGDASLTVIPAVIVAVAVSVIPATVILIVKRHRLKNEN